MEFDNINNIDQQLHDKLYSQEVAPSDDLWAKIAGDIEDRKPKVFWWKQRYAMYAALFVLLTIVSGIGYVTLNNISVQNNVAINSTKSNHKQENSKSIQQSNSSESQKLLSQNNDLTTSKYNALGIEKSEIINEKDRNRERILNSIKQDEVALMSFDEKNLFNNNEVKMLGKSSGNLSKYIPQNHEPDSNGEFVFENMMKKSSSLMQVKLTGKGENEYTNVSSNESIVSKSSSTTILKINKSDSIDKKEITVLKDSSSSKSKEKKQDKTRIWNLKPSSIVFQTNFGIPDYDNLSNSINTETNRTKVTANIRSKAFSASVMLAKEIHPNFEFHIGVLYQQTNFQLSKYTAQKMDKTLAVKFDTLLNTVVNQGTTTQLTTYVGYDTDCNVVYLSPVDSPIVPNGFSPKASPEITSNISYLGVPIELMFKKSLWTDVQLELLAGFSSQFMIYNSNTSELPINAQSNQFNYYGSLGLGYNITSKMILSGMLNIKKLNASQYSLNSDKSKSQILYSPELRLTLLLD